MAVMRCKQQIRLTGKEAKNFLRETGRYQVPKTLHEYNAALEQAAKAWEASGTPEGVLLAALLYNDMIPE